MWAWVYKREKQILYVAGGAVSICLILLFSGFGVLVGESSEAGVFGCDYFSGRGTVKIVLLSSEGYNQCPFIKRI
jgi:hypothetical protein